MSGFAAGLQRVFGRPAGRRRRSRTGRAGVVTAAGMALVLVLPAASSAAPGTPDAGFGSGGKVTTDFASGEEQAGDLVVQADGRIVVVGGSNGDFALARYNTDGGLDTSFGTGGRTVTDIGGGGADTANAVALQSDGRIVVVGTSEVIEGGCCWMTVARYNTDGGLDTGFGSGGKVLADFGAGGAEDGLAVAVQPDGKIVAAGHRAGAFAVARLNADGSLDGGFGNAGRVVTTIGNVSIAYGVGVQSGGKLVAAGYTGDTVGNYDFALARYNANGSLDTGFGTGGTVTTNFGSFESVHDLAVLSDDRIVAAGASGLARYNANGSLDTGFGTGGKVDTDLGNAKGLAVQPDGRIVVADGSGPDFGVFRYNANGTLDTGFGTDGRTVTDFGAFDTASGVTLQSDGGIVVAGSSGSDFALARYEGGGVAPGPDPTPTPTPSGVDVAVTAPASTTVSLGDQGSFIFTVTNTNATAPATGVTLTDALTGPATVLSATPGQGTCSTTATGASCALGSLAAGAGTTVTVVVEPTAVGSLSQTATVAAREPDPATANNTAQAAGTVNNARGCTIVGTSGPNNLVGTSGSNVICGLGGDDVINAGSGNDTVYGGSGNDRTDGGWGDDALFGGPGNDTLTGYYGNDRLNTVDQVSGNDVANGGSGYDSCSTDSGDTRISCP